MSDDEVVNIASAKLGYIGVTPLVFDGSIKENLLYGNSNEIKDQEIHSLLNKFSFYSNDKDVDLDENISNKSLSSGQLQNLIHESNFEYSDILLLDEATSNLDSYSKKLIFEILKDQKITIINSTHNKDDFQYDYQLNIQTDGEIKDFKLTENS